MITFINDAKVYEKLLEIEKKIDKILQKEEFPVLTDPIQYTDPLGNEGSYHREGEYIVFTADFPPMSIDIITESLVLTLLGKKARVKGWSKSVMFEAVNAQAEYDHQVKISDSHNFVESAYGRYSVTFPMTGTYKVVVEQFFNKGDILVLDGADILTVKRLK